MELEWRYGGIYGASCQGYGLGAVFSNKETMMRLPRGPKSICGAAAIVLEAAPFFLERLPDWVQKDVFPLRSHGLMMLRPELILISSGVPVGEKAGDHPRYAMIYPF